MNNLKESFTEVKKRILVICTGNSCRSQMAEGFFRYHGGKNVDIYSAGTHPSFVHPLAISVMREKGIDISRHKSEHVAMYVEQPFDYVITVCDSAKEQCPIFPNAIQRLHWRITNPADFNGSDETVIESFRKVRNHIEETVVAFLKESDMLNRVP